LLRLSVPGAPARLAELLEAADKVATREILHGVLSIFSRQGAGCTDATEVGAGTVSEPAQTLGDFFHAAGKVATSEILRSVLEIFLRQALVYALAIMAIVVAVVVVVMMAQILQEISDERSGQKSKWETHSCSPCCQGCPRLPHADARVPADGIKGRSKSIFL
jgi:hypothetical protein